MSEDQKTLTVLFGAGASNDCHPKYGTSSEPLPQLPLTQNLFHTDGAFDRLNGFKNYALRKYPGASAVGKLYTNNSAQGLEQFLRENLDSGDPNKKRQVYQTKFFLREYIGLMSEYVQTELAATNYVNLINLFSSMKEFKKVLLITTNYDLLLDYYLKEFLHWDFRGWNDYLGPNHNGHQNKWFYIKLHGSVNWRKKIEKKLLDEPMRKAGCSSIENMPLYDPEAVLSAEGTREVVDLLNSVHLLRPESILDNGRWVKHRYEYDIRDANFVSAPLMVLPHDKKEHICDESHFNKAKELIKNTQELWVIGNSLADPHLQELVGFISTYDLRISIVDPGGKAEWLNRLRKIFDSNINHYHHCFTISYKHSACGLSDFVQRGLCFPSDFEKLHSIQN